MKQIDPHQYFPLTHKLAVALRKLSTDWFLCYSKLLSFEWWLTDDPSIPYGATDGRRLILNESGIRQLESGPSPVEMFAFLLCHEALHGLLGHGWRAQRLECKQTANVAADYIINAMIDSHGMKMMDGILLDHKLSGDKSMEQLYRELYDPNNPPTSPMPDLVALEVGDDETEQQVIDKLEEHSASLRIGDSIHAKATGTTATVITDRGSTAQLDWRELLWGYFTQHQRSQWSSPMNRPVFSSSGLVCLGREKRPRGVLVIAIDTSGSVTQKMLNDFLSEVRDIRRQVRPAQTHVLSVSHIVADYRCLEENDDVPVSLNGGGGTAFQPAFDFIEERGIEPDVLVYLTDGISSDAETLRPIPYPVVWVTTGWDRMNQGEIIRVN